MVTFYEEMQGIATDLLTEFNQGSLHLIRVERAEPDPAKPWIRDLMSERKYAVKGVVQVITKKLMDDFASNPILVPTDQIATIETHGTLVEIDGSPVANERVAIEPSASDKFLVDGETRRIIGVRRIPDAGTAVVWTLALRG